MAKGAGGADALDTVREVASSVTQFGKQIERIEAQFKTRVDALASSHTKLEKALHAAFQSQSSTGSR